MQLRRHALVVPVVVLALVAAGCGGGSETSSAEEWADDLCSALVEWKVTIEAAANTLTEESLSRNAVEQAFDEAKVATEMMVEDVERLGAPDTDAGAEAEQSVDQLKNDVEDGIQTIESAIDDASGVSGVLNAVSIVSSALATMGGQLTSTLDSLQQLDGGEELQQAFEDADSCSSLTTG